MNQRFDRYFKAWVKAACMDWGYPEPSEEYYTKIYSKLPEGLQTLLSLGCEEGLIVPHGRTFRLKGIPPKKVYNWFARYSSSKEPMLNWEYFIQVAEFVRLCHVASAKNLKLSFEDHLMDLALYRNDKLIVCCEVKVKGKQIEELIRGIKTYEEGVDFTVADRGNDSLRKAKYIIRRRPEYFYGVAIGTRFEYQVSYPQGKAFELTKDVIPWI